MKAEEGVNTHTHVLASCTCGWSCARSDEQAARTAAEVHATVHRVRRQAVILPIASRLGSWSTAA